MTYPILRLYPHRFIAAVIAVAIAITGFSAAPARAGDDDLRKALAALAGLAVLGIVIKNARDNDSTVRHPAPDWRVDRDDRRGVYPRPVPRPVPSPLPRRADRFLLPQHCLQSFHTNQGQARIFGQRCLQNNYRHVNSLPADCHRQVRTARGWHQGYGARCLNRHGYQLARH